MEMEMEWVEGRVEIRFGISRFSHCEFFPKL